MQFIVPLQRPMERSVFIFIAVLIFSTKSSNFERVGVQLQCVIMVCFIFAAVWLTVHMWFCDIHTSVKIQSENIFMKQCLLNKNG